MLQAAGNQGPIVFVAVCFGLFVLATAALQARTQSTRDRAITALGKDIAALGKDHRAAMDGAYELMRAQGEQHLGKMERVLGMVGETVRANNAERSMDAREMTAALHDYKSVVQRATTVLERVQPTGPNGKSS